MPTNNVMVGLHAAKPDRLAHDRERWIRSTAGPFVVLIVGLAAFAAGLPSTGAAFTAMTSNTGNSFSAASSFADPMAYGTTGPSSTRTSSGTMTVSYPASTAENDLLLLVEVNGANQNITTPTGWTLLADAATQNPEQFRFTVWWKLAGASDSSVDLDVHTNASGANAWVVRLERAGGYPPIPVTATASVANGTANPSATLTPSPDVTVNQQDATVISLVAIRDANVLTLSTPAGFTLRNATTQSATGQAVALGIADRAPVADGTTVPSPQWGQSATASQWAWATIAFS